MILERYPGLFNIFADSNQTIGGAFNARTGGSSERDFSSLFLQQEVPITVKLYHVYIYNCNRQNLKKIGAGGLQSHYQNVGVGNPTRPPNPIRLKGFTPVRATGS